MTSLNVALSLLALLVAGLSALYGRRQWKASEAAAHSSDRSAAAAEESAKAARQALASQRAWVTLDAPQITGRGDRMFPRIASITFMNTGATPALNLETYYHWTIRPSLPEPLDYPPPPPDQETSRGTLGPNGTGSLVLTFSLDPQLIADMENDRFHLYVYGFFKYLDVFHDTHFTYWCLNYEPRVQQFAYHAFGNSVT